MEQRTRIEGLKEMVKDTRCYDKLLDAIGECIYHFAEAYAEEFEATTNELMVVAEEMVYNRIADDEELSERLMDEMELEAREWLNAEDSWDTETVANAVMGIHEGYRCEPEEVPFDILTWAKRHETGDR